MVRVENLTKVYYQGAIGKKKQLKAADNVNFSISRGEIMGLVGESGSGKSTVGKSLLNLITPNRGRVTFNDTCLFDIDKKQRLAEKKMIALRQEMQIIFQNPYASLNPQKTIMKTLVEGIRRYNIVSKSQEKSYCEELLRSCGLEESLLWRYPHEFSGGQRQRIAIARALSIKPKFIVCDEPTAALDVSVQSQILNLMLDLKETLGLTYLFISHNLGVVKHFCDTVAVMYLGRIVEKGPVKEIIGGARHPYSQVLLSSIPKGHPMEPSRRISFEEGDSVSSGCPFYSRCPKRLSKCLIDNPTLKKYEGTHEVACFLYD